MKTILKGKSGVTVLEGVIALGLLALITAGAFGVLLSASRQSSLPDMHEEMIYAVEKAADQLQVYIEASATGELGYSHLPGVLKCGLCGELDASGECKAVSDASQGYTTDRTPLSTDSGKNPHEINCMLPPSCDKNNGSSFSYTVSSGSAVNTYLVADDLEGTGTLAHGDDYDMTTPSTTGKQITFTIRCNGYEL